MKKNGFTVIEVLMAVGILASGIVLVANAWSGNHLQMRKSRLYSNVATLLERKMTELEVRFDGKTLEEIPDELSGDFEGFPQYKWTFKSKEFEMPDLTPLLISEEGGSSDLLITMVKQTGEYISKSVKEGTLTISVQVKGKNVEYHVTRLFVDYNRPLGLGDSGGGGN